MLYFNVFFDRILHEVSVAILRDLGSQVGGKSMKKSIPNRLKTRYIFVCILESIFVDFLCFQYLLQQENDERCHFLDLLHFDFKIDFNLFWGHFLIDFGVENRCKIL